MIKRPFPYGHDDEAPERYCIVLKERAPQEELNEAWMVSGCYERLVEDVVPVHEPPCVADEVRDWMACQMCAPHDPSVAEGVVGGSATAAGSSGLHEKAENRDARPGRSLALVVERTVTLVRSASGRSGPSLDGTETKDARRRGRGRRRAST